MTTQTNTYAIQTVPFYAGCWRGAKRLVLGTVIAAYRGGRGVTLGFCRLLLRVVNLYRYVRGVHLLALEKIADPPVETLRLLNLPAGGATFKMALVTPGLIEDHIVRH